MEGWGRSPREESGRWKSSLLSGRGRTGSPRVAPRLPYHYLGPCTAPSAARHQNILVKTTRLHGVPPLRSRASLRPLPARAILDILLSRHSHDSGTRPGPCLERTCHILRITLPALRKLTQCLLLQLRQTPNSFFFYCDYVYGRRGDKLPPKCSQSMFLKVPWLAGSQCR